jgi:group II intron reverse transcriptase/maturase
LYSLHHVIDLDWMMEAYRMTRRDGATGIDGVTAADYEVNLEANLKDLLEHLKSGRYLAPPVRRAYIPKADGSQWMLGIPTFEDKVAQRAVTMVLDAIYEQDFLPRSYGFRPGRSAHQALRTLQNVLWAKRLYSVLDIDIRKYNDSIAHSHLRAFLDQRVTDGVIRRMIDKWLKAGAVEDGLLHRATEGHPARRCDLALPLEHLPALRAGRMVRDRGEAASQRGVHPCLVRRRRADGVRQYRRR